MEKDKVLEVLMDIKADVSACKATLTSATSQLQNHENRIVKLEDERPAHKSDIKDDMLRLLAKAIIIALTVIGSLTGATAMIKQVFAATPN